MATSDSYHELSREEAVQIKDGAIKHASHVMLYAKMDEKLFDCHDIKYAVLMQVRYDGTLGFPGGIVDKGETPEMAVNREMCEELGCIPEICTILDADHVMSQVSYKTQFCLHFYAKQISIETLQQIEANVTTCKEYGAEVMGLVRCPLYTLPNGGGLPVFLQHQYIGTSRTQLLQTIKQRGLLTDQETQAALELKLPSNENDEGSEMISREQALTMEDHVIHESCVMLYAPVTDKLFGQYDVNHTIMVQMKYDGTVGFPKFTHVERGETLEVAINREICKVLGCNVDKLVMTPADHLFSRVSHVHGKKFCLHHYTKEVGLETVRQFEKLTLTGSNYGQEVLGVIRCPLYTLPNGLGFPAFLKFQFDGDSKDRLLHAIRERKLLSQTELAAAIDNCTHVKTLVTVQDADV